MKTKNVSKGMVYVFTGDGKGKTSAALGVATRALLNKMKVGWVAWYKQRSWKVSEFEMLKIFGEKLLEMHLMGDGFYLKKDKGGEVDIAGGGKLVDKASFEEHREAANHALEKAAELINIVDVLILDEINNAIADKLIEVGDVIDLLERRGKVHVILTGRDANEKIVKVADLVTKMEKIKHPYDKGVKAIKGLDF